MSTSRSATAPPLRSRLRDHWQTLSASERRVAESILSTYPQVAFATVNDVAAGAETSARSVMRFVQRLGYAGFSELQAELRADVERRWSSPIARLGLARGGTDVADIVSVSLERAAVNLDSTASIDALDIEPAARALVKAGGSVFLFGAGKALALASYLWFELMLLRPRCYLLSGGHLEVLDQLIDLSRKDAVVVFDFRRYPRLGSTIASLAKSRGAHVVTISDAHMSPASVHANESFAVRTESNSVLDSYVAAFALVDLVAEMAIKEIPKPTLGRRLRAYEDLTSRVDAFWEGTGRLGDRSSGPPTPGRAERRSASPDGPAPGDDADE